MTNGVNIRELVLDILIEVMEKGQYSHLVIKGVLDKYQYLEKQDRAFLTRLAEGTLEHIVELDYRIDAFSGVKVKKMKPLIRNLLRMSVYQIRYMDSVPDSAACNEAVKLAKKRGFARLSGFVNGVLRSMVREPERVVYPDKIKQPLQYLSVAYSMPLWIVEKWSKQYGTARTEEILSGFGQKRGTMIRTNLLQTTPEEVQQKLTAQGITVVQNEKLPYAFEILGYDYLEGLSSFVQGDFYIQDLSSMMVAEYANPKSGSYIIDVCAAPGGKSTHLAEMLKGTGMVEARDLTEYKVSLLEENRARHKLSNMVAVQMDATVKDAASVDKADVLICDLPCSGLGVLGKKTDIRYKMTPEKQKELVALQRRILSVVHSYVKAGGTMIYSTCTINEEENEDNVQWFLREYPQFSLVKMEQMYPGEFGQDGFFIAGFVRE